MQKKGERKKEEEMSLMCMVACARHPNTLKVEAGGRQEDQEFKVIISYTMSSGPTWAT